MNSLNHHATTILVTGATGTVGRCIVQELLLHNQPVRALVRSSAKANLPPEVGLVEGDLEKPQTLADAFTSINQVVLLAEPDTIESSLKAAKEANVAHVVLISSASVTAGYDTTWNYVAEQAVQRSGLAWTIVRPGEFMMNALQIWGHSIRTNQHVVEPFPDQIGSPIHEQDIADVVVANLLDKTRQGRIDTIVGPENISKRQQIETIAKVTGKKIVINEATPEEARRFYKKQGGFAADNADFLFGFESYDGVEGEYDEPHDTKVDEDNSEFKTIAQVINKPARTFHQWVRDHLVEFKS